MIDFAPATGQPRSVAVHTATAKKTASSEILPTKSTTFRCPVELREKAIAKAKAEGRTLANYLVRLLTIDVEKTCTGGRNRGLAEEQGRWREAGEKWAEGILPEVEDRMK